MGEVLAAATVIVLFAGFLVGLPLLAARTRRRGTSGAGLFQPFEDLWHPAARRALVEVQVQEERTDAPLPGDPRFRVGG
jgi:hypothetical protein